MSELVRSEAPRPDQATVAPVRRALGARVPPGMVRTAPRMYRVDLLGRELDADTAALVVLWLGGTRRISVNTRIAYCDDILQWAQWTRANLGRRFALDLHRAEVTMWLTHQQQAGASESSIARRLSALSSLYRYAQGWGLPVTSPISNDDHRPKLNRGRKATSARVLDATEVAAMIAAAENDRDVIVMGVLFTNTIRVSELCLSNRDSVDDDGPAGCWLRITRKGGKTTRVPLDLIVCRVLDHYNATRPEWTGTGPEPLLLNNAGKRLTRDDVKRITQRLARRAGIPRPETVTPHSMRASSITDQISRGVPPQHLQELSGHADLRTLMIYIEEQGKTERLRKMSADLGRVLRDTPTERTSNVDHRS